jgi:hypothetical protein
VGPERVRSVREPLGQVGVSEDDGTGKLNAALGENGRERATVSAWPDKPRAPGDFRGVSPLIAAGGVRPPCNGAAGSVDITGTDPSARTSRPTRSPPNLPPGARGAQGRGARLAKPIQTAGTSKSVTVRPAQRPSAPRAAKAHHLRVKNPKRKSPPFGQPTATPEVARRHPSASVPASLPHVGLGDQPFHVAVDAAIRDAVIPAANTDVSPASEVWLFRRHDLRRGSFGRSPRFHVRFLGLLGGETCIRRTRDLLDPCSDPTEICK